jgi:hypothetical protein
MAFAATLLPACSKSPETAAGSSTQAASDSRSVSPEQVAEAADENFTETAFGGDSDSLEWVAKSFFEATSEGRVGEALLEYGSNASIEKEARKAVPNKEMARPALECAYVRSCAQEEWENILVMGEAPEKALQALRSDWDKFDREIQERRRLGREMTISGIQQKGGFVSISTTLVSQTGDMAQVRVERKYGNGSTESDVVPLVKESGEWKVGLK